MTNQKMVEALLKLFPTKWRSEYGIELGSLLERGSLTPTIVWDVFRSGICERFRQCPIWVKAAAFVAGWYFLGLFVNTMRAMPPKTYNLFWRSSLGLEIVLGFWFKRAGAARPGRLTGYTVLLGSIPMLLTELLRKLHLLDPTILNLQGHIGHLGHGFTEFAYRGISNRYDFYACAVVVLVGSAFASIAGWLGAQIADAIHAFQTARIRRSHHRISD